jgi:hypothetical protein
MIECRLQTAQRGVVTIFVAMILLILITLMVVTAFSLSTMNLKAVGNVQTRNEAIAAAEKSIELAIDGSFWESAIVQEFDIDVDHDTRDDYRVTIAVPTCVRATRVNLSVVHSEELIKFGGASGWNTIWDLDATAVDQGSGTRVRVRQGVRVLMSNTNKDLYCGT